MASITPTILQNNLRSDGTWIVVFRLTHRRKSVFIKTSHVIDARSLDKDRKRIKTKFIIDYLSDDIRVLQHRISAIGMKVETMSASDIKRIITADTEQIDFIEFATMFYEKIKLTKKRNSTTGYRSLINHLKDYQNGKKLLTSDITSKYIRSFLEYLTTEKKITRHYDGDKVQVRISKVTSGNSLSTAYTRFQKIFNECKYHYNDEDIGMIRIPQNPFTKVPMPKATATKKRSLTVVQIRKIIAYQPVDWSEQVGKNVFLLTFFLCGINLIDLKANISGIVDGRLSYNRSKVENRRKDKGFISISVPQEAKPLVDWFISVEKKWSTSRNMAVRVNYGLRSMARKLGIDNDITVYYARHSFATIARNDCRCRKEDVAMALNHTDTTHSVTDIYINPDWSIIDEVQKKVIDYINEDLKN